MHTVLSGIMAIVLTLPYGLHLPEKTETGRIVTEQDIRTASASHYSELLRLACLNGWKFRQRDVAAGLKRHFAEMKLRLVEEGATIVPLSREPEPEVTEIFFGLVASSNPDRRACFAVRWRNRARKDFPAAPEVRPVAN